MPSDPFVGLQFLAPFAPVLAALAVLIALGSVTILIAGTLRRTRLAAGFSALGWSGLVYVVSYVVVSFVAASSESFARDSQAARGLFVLVGGVLVAVLASRGGFRWGWSWLWLVFLPTLGWFIVLWRRNNQLDARYASVAAPSSSTAITAPRIFVGPAAAADAAPAGPRRTWRVRLVLALLLDCALLAAFAAAIYLLLPWSVRLRVDSQTQLLAGLSIGIGAGLLYLVVLPLAGGTWGMRSLGLRFTRRRVEAFKGSRWVTFSLAVAVILLVTTSSALAYRDAERQGTRRDVLSYALGYCLGLRDRDRAASDAWKNSNKMHTTAAAEASFNAWLDYLRGLRALPRTPPVRHVNDLTISAAEAMLDASNLIGDFVRTRSGPTLSQSNAKVDVSNADMRYALDELGDLFGAYEISESIDIGRPGCIRSGLGE